MKTVILAAGEGKRMRPLTSNRSKVMLPVAGKPILEHLINNLIKAGCRSFLLVTGYCGHRIEQHFGNGGRWGVKIEYCLQKEASGTASALGLIENVIKDDLFLVLNGDCIFATADLQLLLASSQAKMGVVRVSDAAGLGVVEINGSRVYGIREKPSVPSSNLANAGAYLFSRHIFDAIRCLPLSERGEYELTSAIQLLIDKGFDFGWHELGSWITFSYPWDLLTNGAGLYQNLDDLHQSSAEDNVIIRGRVGIGANTIIRSGSYIEGPVYIGSNCRIGPNCYIRPATAIGDGCHIGTAVEIKNSIIMENTNIPHLSYVGDSIIGAGCNLGAGTNIANLRFDQRNVCINGIDTHRRKMGAVIGDGVLTGINASINAGCVIGSNSVICPGAVARGYFEAGSLIS